MNKKSKGNNDASWPFFNAEEAKEMNIIGKKIQEERHSRKMTLAGMSKELEKYGLSVHKSVISKWELGIYIPNSYHLIAICHAFGVEDAASFFSGTQILNAEGRKKIADYRDDLIASGKYRNAPLVNAIKFKQMPVYLSAVAAGTGNPLDGDDFEMVDFPESTVPIGADFAVKVSGNSMEPVYSSGQIIWVKETSELHPGEVGVFVLDGSGYVKMYCEQEPEDAEEYTDYSGVLHRQPVLVSYNKEYAPIVVTTEQQLKIVGKVLN